jgi:hypothetical protein
MKEELGVAAGTWRKSSDDSTFVSVNVYSIATVKAATKWFSPRIHSPSKDGWTRRAYPFGDDALIATYADPRGFAQVNLNFRKGWFLVFVSARSEETARRFADFFLMSVSNWLVSGYLMYEVLTANGITEIIEHRRMEPISTSQTIRKARRKLRVQD